MTTEPTTNRTLTGHDHEASPPKSARPAHANTPAASNRGTATAATFTELTVLHPACPWRPPDWRLQRAQLLAAGHHPEPFDDEAALQAAQYLRRLDSNTGGSLPAAFVDIGVACGIHTAVDTSRRDELQARALAGQPVELIASRVNLPAEVVDVYARLCFDVADSRSAIDWVVNVALGMPRWPSTGPSTGDVWRALGALAPAEVLDVVIAEDRRLPEPVVPDRAKLAAQARLLVTELWASRFTEGDAWLRVFQQGLVMFKDEIVAATAADPRLELMIRTVGLTTGTPPVPGQPKRPASRRKTPSMKQMVGAARKFTSALQRSAIEKRGQAAAANAATGKLASAPEALASWCLEAGFW